MPPRGRRASPKQPCWFVAAGASPQRQPTEAIELYRSQDCHKIWAQGSGIPGSLRTGAATTSLQLCFVLQRMGSGHG